MGKSGSGKRDSIRGGSTMNLIKRKTTTKNLGGLASRRDS